MTANRGRERIIYSIMKAIQTNNRNIVQLECDTRLNYSTVSNYLKFLFKKGYVYEFHPKNGEHQGTTYYGLTADGCMFLQRMIDCGIFQLVEGFA